MSQIVEMGKTLSNDIPLDKSIWAPGGSVTPIRIRNFIQVLLFHIMPALLVDILLKVMGQKPFLAKLQRKIYTANVALEYFILHNWDFKNNNFIRLASEIKPEDNKDFYYRDFIEFDITLYFRNCIFGARRYLLKQKDEDIPKAREHHRRMKLLDRFVKTLVMVAFLYIVLVKFNLVGLLLELTSSRHSYGLKVDCK